MIKVYLALALTMIVVLLLSQALSVLFFWNDAAEEDDEDLEEGSPIDDDDATTCAESVSTDDASRNVKEDHDSFEDNNDSAHGLDRTNSEDQLINGGGSSEFKVIDIETRSESDEPANVPTPSAAAQVIVRTTMAQKHACSPGSDHDDTM